MLSNRYLEIFYASSQKLIFKQTVICHSIFACVCVCISRPCGVIPIGIVARITATLAWRWLVRLAVRGQVEVDVPHRTTATWNEAVTILVLLWRGHWAWHRLKHTPVIICMVHVPYDIFLYSLLAKCLKLHQVFYKVVTK